MMAKHTLVLEVRLRELEANLKSLENVTENLDERVLKSAVAVASEFDEIEKIMEVLIEGGKARDEKLEQLEKEVDQVKVDVAIIKSDLAKFGIKLDTLSEVAKASQEDVQTVAEGLLRLIKDKEKTHLPGVIQYLSKKLTKNATKGSLVDMEYLQKIVAKIDEEKAKDLSYIQKNCHLNRQHEDEKKEDFDKVFTHLYIHGHESEKDKVGHPAILGPKWIGLKIMPEYFGMYQRDEGFSNNRKDSLVKKNKLPKKRVKVGNEYIMTYSDGRTEKYKISADGNTLEKVE